MFGFSEATCDDRQRGEPKYPHEIIEFPAVIIDSETLMTVDTFQSYVRPVLNRILTPFCVNLTGISQVSSTRKIPLLCLLLDSRQWSSYAILASMVCTW